MLFERRGHRFTTPPATLSAHSICGYLTLLSVVAGDKIHEPPSVLVKDGMLLATVQVASVNAEGRLRLPTHVKAIWLDVGTSSQLTICSQGDCQNQSIFILGFEPLQD